MGLRRIFDSIDTDKNEKISTDELRKALKSGKETFSDEDITFIMKLVDQNHDKEVDYAEFQIMKTQILKFFTSIYDHHAVCRTEGFLIAIIIPQCTNVNEIQYNIIKY